MFGALKPGFRSLATLKLVVNVVAVARFPCDVTIFLFEIVLTFEKDELSVFRLCDLSIFGPLGRLPCYVIAFCNFYREG